jgi:hypothetical protein
MIVSFKELKELLHDVDRNTLETIVIKHLLRLTAKNLFSDVLYNACTESTADDISQERYNYIVNNKDNSCPDLYPKE